MGHLVRYRSPEGEQRYEDVADLDAAVERVEHLRNVEGVSDVQVYREVPLEFRTYVRVAVADDRTGGSDPGRAERTGGSNPSRSSAEAPSGAAVIAPPPSGRQGEQAASDEPSAEAEEGSAENRRISLFNRGQAS